jgi:hypothetical protein
MKRFLKKLFVSPRKAFEIIRNDKLWNDYTLDELSLKEYEEIISKDAHYSYYYANMILENRFPLGEKAISKDARYSFLYACNVLKSRFIEGEEAISKNTHYSFYYVEDVIDDRFVMAEDLIRNDPNTSLRYVCFLKIKSMKIQRQTK